MMMAPRPDHEDERLAELEAYQILDTTPEEAFDDLATLAATLCNASTAMVTFVDEDRQWNKACVGTDESSVDREVSFCGHLVADPSSPLVVENAREDPRFSDNPLVTGEPGIRFYAGAPITSPRGFALGTVCVTDDEPRELSDSQLEGLKALARQASRLLEERADRLSLGEESQFLQGVVDNLAEHVAVLDPDGKILATNQAWDAFAEENGDPAGPGQNYLAATHAGQDRDTQGVLADLKSLLAGERDRLEFEYPCHGPETKRWFRATITAFEHRGHRRAVVAHRDITQARLAEEALKESEQQLRVLADHVDHVLWLFGPGFDEVHYVSPGFEELFGRSRQRLYDDPSVIREWVVPEDRETFVSFLTGDVDGPASIRYRVVLDDGRTRPVESRAFPVRDSSGEVVRVAGFTRDVTQEENVRETERRQAREQARTAELKQLVFATSHTLQTQVRQVVSFAQMLERQHAGELGQDGLELLRYVESGVHELQSIHKALRRYGEETTPSGAHQAVDLGPLAHQVLEDLEAEIGDVDADVVVESLPTVDGDPDQLRALLHELVFNALTFAGDQPPAVRIGAQDRGSEWAISVEDDGIGFPAEHAERIFSVFEQLERSPGTGRVGMGLTIARRIVENHDGEIHAVSSPGTGARFEFTLPAAEGTE